VRFKQNRLSLKKKRKKKRDLKRKDLKGKLMRKYRMTKKVSRENTIMKIIQVTMKKKRVMKKKGQ